VHYNMIIIKILGYQINGTDMFNNRQLRGGQYLGYNFNTKKLINIYKL